MQVMDYINAHREDENPCECVILPDGSIEDPTPSHIEKLAQIAGEDKISINKKMDKNMEPLLFMVEYTGCMLVWQTRVVVLPDRRTGKYTGDTVLCSPAFSQLSEGAGRGKLCGVCKEKQE